MRYTAEAYPIVEASAPPLERAKGLTRGQRNWIKRAYHSYAIDVACMDARSDGGLYVPHYAQDGELSFVYALEGVQVHHIVPQRWSYQRLNTDPDIPTNLVPLTSRFHIGEGYKGGYRLKGGEKPNVIHIDNLWAYRNYWKKKFGFNSYQAMFSRRNDLVNKGVKYWNTNYDDRMLAMAMDVYYFYTQFNPIDMFPVRPMRMIEP